MKYVRLLCTLFLSINLLVSCNAQNKNKNKNKNHKFTNALVNESSPYLLQHAHNPVNWFPWSNKALKQAKEEQKLIVISVGYAACHWCHVMEHESFEDEEVAKLMNDNFVAIKVDREERPDIDDIYMSACQLMNKGGCGWPLNVIALPDGRPIFAGTYYPKDAWMKILENAHSFYTNTPEEAKKIADDAMNGIQAYANVSFNPEEAKHTEADLQTIYNNLISEIDFSKGGTKRKMKFPMPNSWQFLLRYHFYTKDAKALEAVNTTLKHMANGGIYDHLGGGFARYSTDPDWKVPHFEKMLYDNAQLVSLYSEAYQVTQNEQYKQVVYETLAFVERELMDKSNGFYSSLDADSEGEEGKFYVWKKAEIDKALGSDADLFNTYYSVTEFGNWEHNNNILFIRNKKADVAKRFKINQIELEKKLKDARKKLLSIRNKRIRPGLDDKIITAWNALMLKGYVDAYQAFGDERFLDMAKKNANFILSKCMKIDGQLYRIHKDGKPSINGFLDDYALTMEALIALYQVTFEEKWLFTARDMMGYVQKHFYDKQSKMFFYTSDLDDPLIVRQINSGDNVIPGSNSTMAKVLHALGSLLEKEHFLTQSEEMLNNVKPNLDMQPRYHSNWNMLLFHLVHTPYEVAIVGNNAENIRRALSQNFLPNSLYLGGKTTGEMLLLENKLIPGQTTIFVCKRGVCKLPVTEVDKAMTLILE